MAIFALLVNPRDGVPVYARKVDTESVTVHYLLPDALAGHGYFNTDMQDYALSEDITGLPRVHTSRGVKRKGAGLGTMLYTGLCTAASLHDAWGKSFPLGVEVSGPGISSEPNSRSEEASAWWDRARTVYGLASRQWSRYGAADQYLFTTAQMRHLVAATAPRLTALRWVDIDERSMSLFGQLDAEAFAAINVGSLWKSAQKYTERRRASLFRTIRDLAEYAGCSSAVIAGMDLRFATKSDVEPEPWTHPGYVWTADDVRTNPTRKSTRVARPKLARAKRMPPVRAKFYGVRRNPPTIEPALAKELTGLAARRHKLGWDVFAADPDAP